MMKKHLFLALSLGALAFAFACSGGSDPDAEYADDMAREHAEDTPVSNDVSEVEPAVEIATQSVTYATVEGESVTGYLAEPANADGPVPGVVVIQEWWGLNDNIRSMADQLAGQGYRALAVDLYGGESASTPDEARELMTSAMENEARLADNLGQAVAYLSEESPRIGTIGWCFGGGWSLATALANPEDVDAAVMYYGRVVTDESELEKLQAPLVGFFGAEDQGIPVDSVREFEAALGSLGKDAEIHVYEGAGHAFANPSGQNYQEEPAEDSWARTLAFFEEHLKNAS
jgi:carboxymethylenebutenolidase